MSTTAQELTEQVIFPPSDERNDEFISTIHGIATSTDKNRSYNQKHFACLFQEFCSPHYRDFWKLEMDLVRGLLNEDWIKDELKKRGILAWFSNSDRIVRIVNLEWLDDDAALIEWMNGDEQMPGGFCQACGIYEMSGNAQLSQVQREIKQTGLTDRPKQVKDRVHVKCYDLWDKLLSRYGVLEHQEMTILARAER